MPYGQLQQIGIKTRRVILALRTSGVYPNTLNVCAQTSIALACYPLGSRISLPGSIDIYALIGYIL